MAGGADDGGAVPVTSGAVAGGAVARGVDDGGAVAVTSGAVAGGAAAG